MIQTLLSNLSEILNLIVVGAGLFASYFIYSLSEKNDTLRKKVRDQEKDLNNQKTEIVEIKTKQEVKDSNLQDLVKQHNERIKRR